MAERGGSTLLAVEGARDADSSSASGEAWSLPAPDAAVVPLIRLLPLPPRPSALFIFFMADFFLGPGSDMIDDC